jgi:hypothetical protein
VAGLFEGAWKSQHISNKFSGGTFSIGAKTNIISEQFLVWREEQHVQPRRMARM